MLVRLSGGYGADALKNALTLTTEDKSRNQRVACQEIRVTDGRYNYLAFRFIGEVFPLTTEGHIDVRQLIPHILLLTILLPDKRNQPITCLFHVFRVAGQILL